MPLGRRPNSIRMPATRDGNTRAKVHEEQREKPNGPAKLSFRICIFLQNGARFVVNVKNEEL